MANLYEVIRWGNDSDDPVTGGPNGPDTCFLVRAATMDEAVRLAEHRLRAEASEKLISYATAVYELGRDTGASEEALVLRGPYIQSAYCYGWRSWHRNDRYDPWEEKPPQRRG